MAKHYLYNFITGGNNRRGLGYTKDDANKHKPFGFYNFFSILKNGLSKLTIANFLFVLVNIPLVFFLLSYSVTDTVSMPADALYPLYYGVSKYGGSPFVSALLTVSSSSVPVSADNVLSVVFRSVGMLSVFTFGVANIGMTVVCRDIVRGGCAFVWSTFWDGIRRNWKRGFVFGAIDCLLVYVICYDIIAYNANAGASGWYVFMYVLMVFIGFVYLIMRSYIYLQMVTFDLNMRQIIKNAFYLVSLNFLRNLVSVVALAAVLFLEYYFFASGLLLMVSIILPVLILVSLCNYISVYCIWPGVKKYISDPYYKEHPEEDPDRNPDTDRVFTDRG